MSTVIKNIEFSINEVTTESTAVVSGSASTVSTKDYYLRLHVTFEYSSLLGNREAGQGIDDTSLKLATIVFDSNDLVTQSTTYTLPSMEAIHTIAQSCADAKAESLVKVEAIHSHVNNCLNKAMTFDNEELIPHTIYSDTGLDIVSGN